MCFKFFFFLLHGELGNLRARCIMSRDRREYVPHVCIANLPVDDVLQRECVRLVYLLTRVDEVKQKKKKHTQAMKQRNFIHTYLHYALLYMGVIIRWIL